MIGGFPMAPGFYNEKAAPGNATHAVLDGVFSYYDHRKQVHSWPDLPYHPDSIDGMLTHIDRDVFAVTNESASENPLQIKMVTCLQRKFEGTVILWTSKTSKSLNVHPVAAELVPELAAKNLSHQVMADLLSCVPVAGLHRYKLSNCRFEVLPSSKAVVCNAFCYDFECKARLDDKQRKKLSWEQVGFVLVRFTAGDVMWLKSVFVLCAVCRSTE